MIPRIKHSLTTRFLAWIKGCDLTSAPVNNQGGHLRDIVRRLAKCPVHGMERIDGQWWAHTARGWYPLQWYIEQARREQIPIDYAVLAKLDALAEQETQS